MPDGVGTTHHVKIGADHHLIVPGSYRKMSAPLYGSRFTTGDPDYNTLSFWQHWVQSCWIGGIGAESWEDDAMYDEAVGVDTSQHEVMTLSRDLGPSTNRAASGNWDLDGNDLIRIFTVFNSKLYCLEVGDDDNVPASKLYVFTEGTSTWTLVYTFLENTRWMTPFGGYLVFGDGGVTMNRMNTSQVFDTFNKPVGETATAYFLQEYRGHLYTAFGRKIYRLKSNFQWDGSTAFYTAEGVDYINQMEVHLGYLWMASHNGHILRSDGNNTFDMWTFPPHIGIWGLRSFDGKLWVGAADTLDGTNSEEGVLYSFTGAAVTEVKRWGKVGKDCTPGKLRNIGHRMMLGASALGGMGTANGFGIFAYDPVEDALSMLASGQDGVTFAGGTGGIRHAVDDIIYWKGYLYCSVRGHGVFRTKWSFRDTTRALATYDTTAAGASVAALNGGWLTSSDFDAGTPGLLKLWNAITVHAHLPSDATSVFVEVSTDKGVTWYGIGSVLRVAGKSDTRKTLKIRESVGGLPVPVRSPRLKWRVTLRTTDTTVAPQVWAIHVQYLPLPEPNWQWQMRLALSTEQVLLDGTVQTVNPTAKLAALETAYRNQIPIHFQDIDGVSWATGNNPGALITAFDAQIRHIGPTSDGAIEGEVILTLVEAVEAYPA